MSGGIRHVRLALATALFVVLAFAPPAAADAGLEDTDARSGSVAPTAEQLAAVSSLGAQASWNQFGTPRSLIKFGGYLATGLAGADAASVARSWLDANKELFNLSSVDGLSVVSASRLTRSNGHAVRRQ